MDWLPDFKEKTKNDNQIITIKKDKWTGSIEIHILQGVVKVVKMHYELKGE